MSMLTRISVRLAERLLSIRLLRGSLLISFALAAVSLGVFFLSMLSDSLALAWIAGLIYLVAVLHILTGIWHKLVAHGDSAKPSWLARRKLKGVKDIDLPAAYAFIIIGLLGVLVCAVGAWFFRRPLYGYMGMFFITMAVMHCAEIGFRQIYINSRREQRC